MKKLQRIMKPVLCACVVGALMVSCSKDDNDSGPEGTAELSSAELQTILEIDEISGIADSALAELYADDEGSTGKEAPDCYEASYSDSGFTATFNNCVLNGTDNVNGSLSVVYAAAGQSAGFTATFTDFYVGDIKINGTRAFTLDTESEENTIRFTVTSNMTVTLADESEISESGTKTFSFAFGETLDSFTIGISGDWTVQADGNTYSVEVTEELIGVTSCDYLSSGVMNLEKNGLSVTVDFGDGTCDSVATLIYPNGTTEEISLED